MLDELNPSKCIHCGKQWLICDCGLEEEEDVLNPDIALRIVNGGEYVDCAVKLFQVYGNGNRMEVWSGQPKDLLREIETKERMEVDLVQETMRADSLENSEAALRTKYDGRLAELRQAEADLAERQAEVERLEGVIDEMEAQFYGPGLR